MKRYDVIIIGGSYSGLAAAMALGRAMRQVLIIDRGKPCNRMTPFSHNFLTNDGKRPAEIASLARQQVENYNTVGFISGNVISGERDKNGFSIQLESGEEFQASKLIFATGIKDLLPAIDGIAACWGISVLHCPYCHGYEVRNKRTGILANGEQGFEFATLIANWTKDLTLFTNGTSAFTDMQTSVLTRHHINIVEKEIKELDHNNGELQHIVFKDGTVAMVNVIYLRATFEQHCRIPEKIGCELTEEGYIKADAFQKTSVPGIFACGDNVSRLRTVANAVAMGTNAGMMVNKEMVLEQFNF